MGKCLLDFTEDVAYFKYFPPFETQGDLKWNIVILGDSTRSNCNCQKSTEIFSCFLATADQIEELSWTKTHFNSWTTSRFFTSESLTPQFHRNAISWHLLANTDCALCYFWQPTWQQGCENQVSNSLVVKDPIWCLFGIIWKDQIFFKKKSEQILFISSFCFSSNRWPHEGRKIWTSSGRKFIHFLSL